MMRKFFLVAFAVAYACVFPSFLEGCVDFSGRNRAQNVSISAGDVRAKYSLFNEKTSVVVARGLTPDSVVLNASGNYRVEITHPDTGEVYTNHIKAQQDAFAGWSLSPKSIEAPF